MIEARIEKTDGGKFNFYYLNEHPKTGEVTEGVCKDKMLKEIKEFAKRRGLEKDVADLIKQTSGSITQAKREKKQAAETETLENWKLGEWFGRGDKLLNSGKGKVWRKKNSLSWGAADRTYFDEELSGQILKEAGFNIEYAQIFYDHDKKEWSSKELSARRSKKLHKYLTH